MISGVLCYKQTLSKTLLVHGEIAGLSFLCGQGAYDLVRFFKIPESSELNGDLYFDDINLAFLSPEFVVPLFESADFEESLDAALTKTKTFVLADLSYLKKPKAEELILLLHEKFKDSKVLVYAPQCLESPLPLLITQRLPDRLEVIKPRKDLRDEALDAFVEDIALGKTPIEGILVPEAKPLPVLEKPETEEKETYSVLDFSTPEAEKETEDVAFVPFEEEAVEEEESLPKEKLPPKEAFKKGLGDVRKFISKNADYIFAFIFLALAFALNVITHAMPKSENANFPIVCVCLAVVFVFCSVTPIAFIVRDSGNYLSRRAVLAYILECLWSILVASASITLSFVADYGAIANIFPLLFALCPFLLAGAVAFAERKKIKTYLESRKEKRKDVS